MNCVNILALWNLLVLERWKEMRREEVKHSTNCNRLSHILQCLLFRGRPAMLRELNFELYLHKTALALVRATDLSF